MYTDRLNIYSSVIPAAMDRVARYGTNKIERTNLNLRIRLKRLNRKTICYSKSMAMLEACLNIIFWYEKPLMFQTCF
ncbi:IS1 family transposase [Mucilaginibacter terrae]|uniref:IS1 family transposase n=1 Tax=Mucilaginibacter terrae TaxID=1955052 RepID=UPI0035DBC31C